MSPIIAAATGHLRVPALRLLFARFPVEEQEIRLQDAIAASERGTLVLDHLLIALKGDLPVGSALVMIQADGVALVWPPVISCGADDPTVVEDLLMQEICRRIDAAPVKLSQSLLAVDDEADSRVLSRHGFAQAAEMYFLAKTLTPSDVATLPRDAAITTETYRSDNADRFERLIEATYQGSLDCPFLTGVRSGRDAIVSHKQSGQFNPDRWHLYQVDGQDAGVILLNDHPDQDAAELVYVGVAPAARGRGLGRRMLSDGVHSSVELGRAVMFLAVDCENRFANALYSEFDFAELARRRILLRLPSGLARQ